MKSDRTKQWKRRIPIIIVYDGTILLGILTFYVLLNFVNFGLVKVGHILKRLSGGFVYLSENVSPMLCSYCE